MTKVSKLSFEEYQLIFKYYYDNALSMREIGRLLGRNASSISRLLNREYRICQGVWKKMSSLEKALYAWKLTKKRRSVSRKRSRLKSPRIRKLVVYILCKWNWSPETIADFLTDHGLSISGKAIYNFIKKERPLLKEYLFEKGKIRRQRVVSRRGIFKIGVPAKKSIHQRPVIKEEGHWEIDTMHSKKGCKGGILTLRERASKECFYFIIKDLRAETITKIVLPFFQKLPVNLRKTLTTDNGSEFEHLYKLEKVIPEISVYYCDAYKSWQKGSVENGNRELRRYYPKGTDFSVVSEQEIRKVQYKINGKPRKTNGRVSSRKMFKQFLKKAA